MQGKIALEEHFAIPETLQDSAVFAPDNCWPELSNRLLDIQVRRVEEMDRHGIDKMILSLNAPAVQAIADPGQAIELSKRANDYLATEISKKPDRFLGFAALPLQDSEEASKELTRCVKDLGFKGALVNGFSQSSDGMAALYYDLPQYRSFWATVAELDVPFYLHPRNPLASDAKIYDGHRWLLGPTWAFAQETAVHALRLIGSGLFDEYPALQVILGHLGEGIPFNKYRIDHRNLWMETPHQYPAKRRVCDYLSDNFYLTTSGNFRDQTLIDSILEIGVDRVLFSTDWPFENVDHAANWFDIAGISENDRWKIGRGNAERLFKL